jgi:hypothetical protein
MARVPTVRVKRKDGNEAVVNASDLEKERAEGAVLIKVVSSGDEPPIEVSSKPKGTRGFAPKEEPTKTKA